jgi:2-dehydro-3-deoxygluconokinase
LCFGELLLRFCPDTLGNWLQQNSLPFYVGGAEANVAVALAHWQVPAMYVSGVPDHLVGRYVVQYLAQQGIDVSRMFFGGDRLGLYFLPQGTDLKNAGVIYDRAYSSFSQLQPGTIDWDQVLHGVSWLHFSAITPALNQNLADISKAAAAAAAQKGIPVSLDMNYRARLWQWGRAPIDIMPDLVPFCDVLMGNLWAFEKMLGCNINEEKLKTATKDIYLEEAQHLSKNLVHRFPKLRAVANTFRFDQQPGTVQYYATLFGAGQFHVSAEYKVDVIDKVGSGDCFMAGLIYGFYNNVPFAQMLDFATAAAVTKLRETGDATHSTVAVIQKSIKENER